MNKQLYIHLRGYIAVGGDYRKYWANFKSPKNIRNLVADATFKNYSDTSYYEILGVYERPWSPEEFPETRAEIYDKEMHLIVHFYAEKEVSLEDTLSEEEVSFIKGYYEAHHLGREGRCGKIVTSTYAARNKRRNWD